MWILLMSIVLIGNGVQSKRIQKILSKKKLNYSVFKDKKISNYKYLKNKKNNIIFILTPNQTHWKYIDYFHKNSYIFCEKPPVNNSSSLNKLKKISYKKIYFNYNFRYSKIAELLQSYKKKFGKLLRGNILITHGLGLKRNYKKNWRSSKKKSPLGVFETVSTHWIDLVNYIFKIKKVSKPILNNFSNYGSSYDCSNLNIILKHNAEINIYSSYCAPLIKKIYFIFNNGIIQQNEDFLEIRGPAKNFDKTGFFIKPKLIKKIKIKNDKDYNDSLFKSVNYFLKISKNRKHFTKKDFYKSISSNFYTASLKIF